MAVQIQGLFQQGVLLLDEVDLILHPLKSELNWPLGRREPLDFTVGVADGSANAGQRGEDGLRWQVCVCVCLCVVCNDSIALWIA